MATSPQAATLDRKPGWPTGSGVLRWTSTRLIRQHTNQRTEPSRARTSSDLSGSASAPLLPAIRAPEGAAAGPTLPNGEAVIIPPKTRGPSGRQVRTLGLGLGFDRPLGPHCVHAVSYTHLTLPTRNCV